MYRNTESDTVQSGSCNRVTHGSPGWKTNVISVAHTSIVSLRLILEVLLRVGLI